MDYDKSLEDLVRKLIASAGDDPKRADVKDTPKRFAKAWKFWTSGYTKDPKEVLRTFSNPGIDQLVIVPKIDFYSMCEHHLAPFYGQIHIGYLPNGKILGLSKFARLAEIYTRRLQVQERIGEQIASDIMKYLKPRGVGIIIRGIHLCMRSRGVEKQNAEMVTSVMRGFFREKAALRSEFLQLINER